MSERIPSVSENDLLAYVDGQLSAERRDEVEKFLESNEDAAQRVADYQEQNRQLHQLFDPVLQQTVPERLKQARAPRKNTHTAVKVAAAMCLMFVAGSGGWLLRGLTMDTVVMSYHIAGEAAQAHAVYTPEIKHPVEVPASREEHLVKWLSKRLGTELHAPNLTPLGYALVGGRLLPSDSGPAAQFMYEDESGSRLTLYVKRNLHSTNKETAFRYVEQDRIKVFYWIDGDLGYALTGDMDKQKVLQAANFAYSWMEGL